MSKQHLKQVSPLTWIYVDEPKTMSNKKQSSIDWLLESYKQLYYDLHEGKIYQHEYHPKRKEIEQQAKQMHKEEIINAFDDGKWDWSEYLQNNTTSKDIEQYYKETFGGQDNE